jgi:hypothetical protein
MPVLPHKNYPDLPDPLHPLYRRLIIGWVVCLTHASPHWDAIEVTQRMTPQEDELLGRYLFLAYICDKGWRPL